MGISSPGLDLRGPYYNDTGFSDVDAAYGINGSSQNDWTVKNSKINGFASDGIHAGSTHGITIINNRISHNADSGIALFSGGSGSLVEGNEIVYNGQDGIDTNHHDTIIRYNLLSHNGWRPDRGSDKSGINMNGGTNVKIYGNEATYNGKFGIDIGMGPGPIPISNVEIYDNTVNHNGIYGVRFSGSDGDPTDIEVRFHHNEATIGTNGSGCWNLPHDGVLAFDNTCGFDYDPPDFDCPDHKIRCDRNLSRGGLRMAPVSSTAGDLMMLSILFRPLRAA